MLSTTLLFAASMLVGQVDRAAPSMKDNHYLNFWMEYFEGEWDTALLEGEDREGRLKTGANGTWSCHLSPTKTCMLFNSTINGETDSVAVAGYDPKTKAWKEVFFMTNGSHLTQFYYADADALTGDPAGKVIKGKGEFIYPDGRVEKAKIGVEIISRDKCKYFVKQRRIGEEKRPDLVSLMVRKK